MIKITRTRETTLELPTYGRVRALVEPNPITGTIRYDVAGARVVGVFVLEPSFDWDDVDPATTSLLVRFGDSAKPGDRDQLNLDRTNRPVVNHSVTLYGDVVFDAAKAVAGAVTPYELGVRLWRREGDEPMVRVPDRAERRTAALLAALAVHWLNHPDLDRLRCTAARLAIYGDHRLERKQAAIDTLLDERAAVERQLERHRAQYDHMARLLAGDTDQPEDAVPSLDSAAG